MFGRALWILLACISLSSCAFWKTREAPPPAGPLRVANAEQLAGLLEERAGAIQSLKGLFRAQIQGPGIPATQYVEGAVHFHRPDALRLQGFNRFGIKLFELGLGEERYTLRLVNGRLLTGQIADLSRVEKIARPFRLSVLAMSGVIGVEPIHRGDQVALIEDGDRYRLDVYASSADRAGQDLPFRRLWFDRQSLHVVKEQRLNRLGEVEATVEFDDFRAIDLGSMPTTGTNRAANRDSASAPFRVLAQDGDGQSRIEVKFHELTPNVPLTAEELRVAARRVPYAGTHS